MGNLSEGELTWRKLLAANSAAGLAMTATVVMCAERVGGQVRSSSRTTIL